MIGTLRRHGFTNKERAMHDIIREEIELSGQTFGFDLCNKTEVFGAQEISQWWMPVTELYAQRRQKVAADYNHRSITDFYWAKVQAEGATDSRFAQEKLLLAKLLPQVRSQGSRAIFADAFLRPKTRQEPERRADELENLLLASRGEHLTREQFYMKTHELLARQKYPAEIQAEYDDLAGELIECACQTLESGSLVEAVQIASGKWQQFQRSFGRRAGHVERKLVLDALSYEARAAFHQCYSLAWCELLPYLNRKHRLSKTDWIFHYLWHFDKVDEGAAARGEYLSLFHGHVFGLHPGAGPFLQTLTGRELLGDWLEASDSSEAFGRLLHGIYLAMWQYRLERDSSQEDRRARVNLSGRENLVAEEELQASKKTGHVRRKKL